jgi:hypothetical protein
MPKLKYKPHRGRRMSLTVGWNAKVKLILLARKKGLSPSELVHNLILQTEYAGWEQIEQELASELEQGGTVQGFLNRREWNR